MLVDSKKDSGLEGLEDDSPKVTWMRRVYPRVNYAKAPLLC